MQDQLAGSKDSQQGQKRQLPAGKTNHGAQQERGHNSKDLRFGKCSAGEDVPCGGQGSGRTRDEDRPEEAQ
jgi:hypothetical protein